MKKIIIIVAIIIIAIFAIKSCNKDKTTPEATIAPAAQQEATIQKSEPTAKTAPEATGQANEAANQATQQAKEAASQTLEQAHQQAQKALGTDKTTQQQ